VILGCCKTFDRHCSVTVGACEQGTGGTGSQNFFTRTMFRSQHQRGPQIACFPGFLGDAKNEGGVLHRHVLLNLFETGAARHGFNWRARGASGALFLGTFSGGGLCWGDRRIVSVIDCLPKTKKPGRGTVSLR